MKKGIIASLFIFLNLITFRIYGQENIYISSDQFINEGIGFHDKGEYDNAVKSYQKVSKCDPNYEIACYELGLTYYYADKYEQALSKCKEALSLNYDRAFVYSLIGTILDDMGICCEFLLVCRFYSRFIGTAFEGMHGSQMRSQTAC